MILAYETDGVVCTVNYNKLVMLVKNYIMLSGRWVPWKICG